MTTTTASVRNVHRPRLTPGRWLLWAVLVLGALVTIFPVYWMFVTAVSPGGQAQSADFYLWPSRLDWSNFTDVWSVQPVARWFLNSVVIAVGNVLLTVLVSLLAGYAFAKYRFLGRDVLFTAFLVTIMVPIQVIMVPEFLIVAKMSLVNNPLAVILPRAAEAIAVFLTRQFMLDIPDDLIEAARVDGASELTIFTRVILPLCRPLIGVLVILTFVWRWNEFVWPLVALEGVENYTLPLGLNSMHTTYTAPWDAIMAVSALSTIPVLIVFLVFQRQFTQGVATTGLR